MRWSSISIAAGLLLSGWAAVAGEGVPARLGQPISVDRPDQALFNEAVLLYSNSARRAHGRPPLRADIGLSRAASGHAANMARLRTHSHELPVRGQAKLGDRLHRQSTAFRMAAENIAMDKVYRLLGRPISVRSEGCRFTYDDTARAGADPHLREPRRGGRRAVAEVAEAPGVAALRHLPPPRRRHRRRPERVGLRRPLPRAGLRRLRWAGKDPARFPGGSSAGPSRSVNEVLPAAGAVNPGAGGLRRAGPGSYNPRTTHVHSRYQTLV